MTDERDENIAGEDAAPRGGWYAVIRHDGEIAPILLGLDKRWHAWGYSPFEKLPPGWTLGPRLDDLLRDAARWRYVVEDLSPEDFATIDAAELGAFIDAEIARERGQ